MFKSEVLKSKMLDNVEIIGKTGTKRMNLLSRNEQINTFVSVRMILNLVLRLISSSLASHNVIIKTNLSVSVSSLKSFVSYSTISI